VPLLECERDAAGHQRMRDGLGGIAGFAHHDGDRPRGFVEKHAAHRGRDDELGMFGVVRILGWREVDAQREAEPAAGSAAGGHQHERFAGMEPEHGRDRGHQLALVANAEHGAVVDREGDRTMVGGRRHAARMRGDGRAMGTLLHSAVGKVRLNGLDRRDVDNPLHGPALVGVVI
jgi:hypothetical protein